MRGGVQGLGTFLEEAVSLPLLRIVLMRLIINTGVLPQPGSKVFHDALCKADLVGGPARILLLIKQILQIFGLQYQKIFLQDRKEHLNLLLIMQIIRIHSNGK